MSGFEFIGFGVVSAVVLYVSKSSPKIDNSDRAKLKEISEAFKLAEEEILKLRALDKSQQYQFNIITGEHWNKPKRPSELFEEYEKCVKYQ
jgi:hypothetical protein